MSTPETARHVRKYINAMRQQMYDIDTAFDRGDREELRRLAQQLAVTTSHLATQIARYYFAASSPQRASDAADLFSPSAPAPQHASTQSPHRRFHR